MKKSDQHTGLKTGDYSSVGLFLPLPSDLARQFPDTEEDSSPSHITFLYVGRVSPAREAAFLNIVSSQIRRMRGKLTATLNPRDIFSTQNDGRLRAIHHLPVSFSRDMSSMRRSMRRELMDAGFEVQDSYQVYRPHVTLAYMDPGSIYRGPEPKGTFEPPMEVWGLPQVHSYDFDTIKKADLTPALGLPSEAGPCYLAERIWQNIRDPKLREELIEEVEEGGKAFDGRDERRVYKPIRERGPSNSQLVLIPHVQRRMDVRGITVKDLQLSLQNWMKWFNRERSMQTFTAKRVEEELAYGHKIRWDDPKKHLTMIFQKNPRKKEYAIITTYWTGKSDPRSPGSCPLPGLRDASRISMDLLALAHKLENH